MKNPLLTLCILPLLALTPSCAMFDGYDDCCDDDDSYEVERAVCVINGTQAHEAVSGSVTFTERDGGVLVEADITGLTPGKHGFHIHEFGDVSGLDGKSAGGHFNPGAENHGGPLDISRHLGDLGNLEADSTGRATYSRFDEEVRLSGSHTVIGRAIVIHADEDDFTTQPTGNAGGRVGFGVIGVAKEN